MNLTVHRLTFSPLCTQGSLDIDGVFECFTLEPRKDQSQGKPYCIGPGTYVVRLMWSNHFQRVTPHILDVPGFTEVEIHPGNFPTDTEACLLVGQHRTTNAVWNSEEAFDALMSKLSGQTDISITYVEEVAA